MGLDLLIIKEVRFQSKCFVASDFSQLIMDVMETKDDISRSRYFRVLFKTPRGLCVTNTKPGKQCSKFKRR